MSKTLVAQVVIGCAITLSSSSLTQPSQAQETLSFFCDTFDDNYVTKVRTSKGNRAIVSYKNWTSGIELTVKQRCQAVSKRFQNFYNQNLLQYMRSGRVNNLPVICVTPQKGVSCENDHVLITLKQGTDPKAALRSLVEQSQGNSSFGIFAVGYQNSTPPSYFSIDNQGNLYVDMKTLIATAPVD